MVADLIRKLFKLKPPMPKPTQQGTKFKWLNKQWIEVCDTCGGNCGQCGWSIGIGVPASMDVLIRKISC